MFAAPGLIDTVIDRARAAVRHEAARRRVIVELTYGRAFAFPADVAQGLEGAGDGDLGRVVIEGNGYGLHWPTLDVDLVIPDRMAGLLDTRRRIARQAGRVTAESKAMAAQENGAKSGWPRRQAKRQRGKRPPEGDRHHRSSGNVPRQCDEKRLIRGRPTWNRGRTHEVQELYQ